MHGDGEPVFYKSICRKLRVHSVAQSYKSLVPLAELAIGMTAVYSLRRRVVRRLQSQLHGQRYFLCRIVKAVSYTHLNVFAVDCEKLLLGEGADILYGTLVCSAPVEDGRITHVVVENKSGRKAYRCLLYTS